MKPLLTPRFPLRRRTVAALAVLALGVHGFAADAFVLETGEAVLSGSGKSDAPFGSDPVVLRGGTVRSDGGRPRAVLNSVELNGTVTFGTNPNAIGPVVFSRKTGGATTVKGDTRLVVNNTTTWEQPLSGGYQLTKDGTGTLVLDGDTRVKEVIVEHGTLRVSGTLTCDKLEIKAGGTLCGLGAIHCQNIINPEAARHSEFNITHDGKEIPVLVYRPANYTHGPLLVLLHGAKRDAGNYRKTGSILADKLNMLLVVPEFDRVRFDSEAYQEGGILRNGKPATREQWTYSFIEPIVKEMRRREGSDLPYYLVGHSAGGQFLNRMTAFLPGQPERIISVNPGSLIFPTRDQKFPLGFGGLPEELSNDEALKRYLAAPLTLYLGTGDVKSDYLPTDDGAMRQGATRIERGRNCYALGKKLAESHGWPFAWKIVEAEGLAHSSTAMWQHANAEQAVLGK